MYLQVHCWVQAVHGWAGSFSNGVTEKGIATAMQQFRVRPGFEGAVKLINFGK
jgi:hypothetical protein